MAVRQWKTKRGVVKFAVRPFRDGMALRASRGGVGETGGDVIRHAAAEVWRFVPIGQMTSDAVGRIQRVIIADVARRAGSGRRRHVRARESETGDAMIEGGRVPAFGGMTIGAIRRREGRACRGMHRIVGLLPVVQMAGGVSAVRRSDLQIVVVIDMARSTGNVGVPVRERETGKGVIEVRCVPTLCCVTVGAVGRGKNRSRSGVNGIIGLLPCAQVTTGVAAISGRDLQVVIVIDVARSAGNVSVAVRQRKSGGAVIELRVEPGVERVAGLACGGKIRRGVIGIRGLLKVAYVAGRAGRRKPLELPDRRAFMTLLAGYRRVGAE